MTSLEKQLKLISSDIAGYRRDKLTQRDRHAGSKVTASLLFDPQIAKTLENSVVYEIGMSGIKELIERNPSFEQFEDVLFLQNKFAPKPFNRFDKPQESVEQSDKTLKKFLHLLSSYIDTKSGQKCFEYLVRFFQIHNYVPLEVLRCILPYYSSKLFPKTVQILRLEDSRWDFVFKRADQDNEVDKNQTKKSVLRSELVPLKKEEIVARMRKDPFVLEFVCSAMNKAMKTEEKFGEEDSFGTVYFLVSDLVVNLIGICEIKEKETILRIILPITMKALGSTNEKSCIASVKIFGKILDTISLNKNALEEVFSIALKGKHIESKVALIKKLFETQKVSNEFISKENFLLILNSDISLKFLSISSEKFITSALTIIIKIMETEKLSVSDGARTESRHSTPPFHSVFNSLFSNLKDFNHRKSICECLLKKSFVSENDVLIQTLQYLQNSDYSLVQSILSAELKSLKETNKKKKLKRIIKTLEENSFMPFLTQSKNYRIFVNPTFTNSILKTQSSENKKQFLKWLGKAFSVLININKVVKIPKNDEKSVEIKNDGKLGEIGKKVMNPSEFESVFTERFLRNVFAFLGDALEAASGGKEVILEELKTLREVLKHFANEDYDFTAIFRHLRNLAVFLASGTYEKRAKLTEVKAEVLRFLETFKEKLNEHCLKEDKYYSDEIFVTFFGQTDLYKMLVKFVTKNSFLLSSSLTRNVQILLQIPEDNTKPKIFGFQKLLEINPKLLKLLLERKNKVIEHNFISCAQMLLKYDYGKKPLVRKDPINPTSDFYLNLFSCFCGINTENDSVHRKLLIKNIEIIFNSLMPHESSSASLLEILNRVATSISVNGKSEKMRKRLFKNLIDKGVIKTKESQIKTEKKIKKETLLSETLILIEKTLLINVFKLMKIGQKETVVDENNIKYKLSKFEPMSDNSLSNSSVLKTLKLCLDFLVSFTKPSKLKRKTKKGLKPPLNITTSLLSVSLIPSFYRVGKLVEKCLCNVLKYLKNFEGFDIANLDILENAKVIKKVLKLDFTKKNHVIVFVEQLQTSLVTYLDKNTHEFIEKAIKAHSRISLKKTKQFVKKEDYHEKRKIPIGPKILLFLKLAKGLNHNKDVNLSVIRAADQLVESRSFFDPFLITEILKLSLCHIGSKNISKNMNLHLNALSFGFSQKILDPDLLNGYCQIFETFFDSIDNLNKTKLFNGIYKIRTEFIENEKRVNLLKDRLIKMFDSVNAFVLLGVADGKDQKHLGILSSLLSKGKVKDASQLAPALFKKIRAEPGLSKIRQLAFSCLGFVFASLNNEIVVICENDYREIFKTLKTAQNKPGNLKTVEKCKIDSIKDSTLDFIIKMCFYIQSARRPKSSIVENFQHFKNCLWRVFENVESIMVLENKESTERFERLIKSSFPILLHSEISTFNEIQNLRTLSDYFSKKFYENSVFKENTENLYRTLINESGVKENGHLFTNSLFSASEQNPRRFPLNKQQRQYISNLFSSYPIEDIAFFIGNTLSELTKTHPLTKKINSNYESREKLIKDTSKNHQKFSINSQKYFETLRLVFNLIKSVKDKIKTQTPSYDSRRVERKKLLGLIESFSSAFESVLGALRNSNSSYFSQNEDETEVFKEKSAKISKFDRSTPKFPLEKNFGNITVMKNQLKKLHVEGLLWLGPEKDKKHGERKGETSFNERGYYFNYKRCFSLFAKLQRGFQLFFNWKSYLETIETLLLGEDNREQFLLNRKLMIRIIKKELKDDMGQIDRRTKHLNNDGNSFDMREKKIEANGEKDEKSIKIWPMNQRLYVEDSQTPEKLKLVVEKFNDFASQIFKDFFRVSRDGLEYRSLRYLETIKFLVENVDFEESRAVFWKGFDFILESFNAGNLLLKRGCLSTMVSYGLQHPNYFSKNLPLFKATLLDSISECLPDFSNHKNGQHSETNEYLKTCLNFFALVGDWESPTVTEDIADYLPRLFYALALTSLGESDGEKLQDSGSALQAFLEGAVKKALRNKGKTITATFIRTHNALSDLIEQKVSENPGNFSEPSSKDRITNFSCRKDANVFQNRSKKSIWKKIATISAENLFRFTAEFFGDQRLHGQAWPREVFSQTANFFFRCFDAFSSSDLVDFKFSSPLDPSEELVGVQSVLGVLTQLRKSLTNLCFNLTESELKQTVAKMTFWASKTSGEAFEGLIEKGIGSYPLENGHYGSKRGYAGLRHLEGSKRITGDLAVEVSSPENEICEDPTVCRKTLFFWFATELVENIDEIFLRCAEPVFSLAVDSLEPIKDLEPPKKLLRSDSEQPPKTEINLEKRLREVILTFITKLLAVDKNSSNPFFQKRHFDVLVMPLTALLSNCYNRREEDHYKVFIESKFIQLLKLLALAIINQEKSKNALTRALLHYAQKRQALVRLSAVRAFQAVLGEWGNNPMGNIDTVVSCLSERLEDDCAEVEDLSRDVLKTLEKLTGESFF